MTDNKNGLNRNAINQSFPTLAGGANTVYADRTYVQGEITNRLSSQDLNITFSPGLTVLSDTSFTGTAQTVINVGIGSSIGDLNNVNINALANDQTLVYDSSSGEWKNSDGASIAKIEDLPFVYHPVATTPKNAFLKTNNTGTSTIFVPVKFVEQVNISEGCRKTGTSTIPVIGTDLTTIPNTTNDDNTNFFIVTSKQGTANYSQRKLEKKNIRLGNFDNDGLLTTDGLSVNYTSGTCPTALDWNPTGTSTGTLTLDLSGYFENVNGNLPVDQGGTGASTAAGARANLGLSIGNADSVWNTGQLVTNFRYPKLPNLLGTQTLQPSLGTSPGLCVVGFGTCHQPGFYKKLVGSDIRIVSSGVSSILIGASGSGYSHSGTSGTITIFGQDEANTPITLGVSYTVCASNGSLESIRLANEYVGFPYLNLNSRQVKVQPIGGVSTTPAQAKVHLFDSYINFGISVREKGVGFRFEPENEIFTNGILKVNNGICLTPTKGWEIINQPPIANLEGVCITSPGTTKAEFLIYNGTCQQWRNKPITGPVTINKDGVTTLGGISPQSIEVDTWSGKITRADFSTLDGLHHYMFKTDTNLGVSRIKDALAKKYSLDSTQPGISGSLVYISSPGSCILTPIPPTNDNNILASLASHTVPKYTNVANTFYNKSTEEVSPNSLFCLADMTSGTCQAALYSKNSFNKYITGTDSGASGGLGVSGNGDLIVTTNNTESITSVVGNTNTLLIGTNPSLGGIQPVKNILINDFVNSSAISSTLQVGISPANLTNYPNFSTGEAAFFTSSSAGSGTCYFAVYNGNNWYGVSLNTLVWS